MVQSSANVIYLESVIECEWPQRTTLAARGRDIARVSV